MKTLTLLIAFMISLAGCSQADQPAAESSRAAVSDSADTIYINGRIYTVNEAQPWAEAVAIRDGMFLVVGSNADVEAVTDEGTVVVDLDGQMAMPGLIDTHSHVLGKAMGKANLNLENPGDVDAMLAEVRAYAEANPDLPFIRGESWSLGVFSNNSPRKELLDEIDSERPIYFYSQTGHSAWVNSKTLELIGIDADSKQTSQLMWDVDPETNEPTGTIREYAMSLVEQALEPTPADDIAPHLQETLRPFSEHGFTSIKPAEGEVPWVQAANMLDEEGRLDVRLFPSWFHRAHLSAMSAEKSREVAGRWQEFKSDMVYPRYVKMYMDGGADSYSVLLFDDYADRPGFKGATSLTTEEFIEEFAYFNSLGLGMMVHVFGDASSRELVHAFEQVRERNGDNGIPLHFSHAFMTQPEEIERLSNIPDVCMDFIALQYRHPSIEGSFLPPIGEERYQKWLNARSAVDAGVPYSFGSDWPSVLEPVLNGFFQMQAWTNRRDPGDPEYGSLNPEQAISLEEAVWGYTQGGAECLGFDWPDKLGSIEEGKLADFIVIDRNIFEVPIDEVKDTNVDMTVVGGKAVFVRN